VVSNQVVNQVRFTADGPLTMGLTNTADLEAWQAKYAPSDLFARTGEINVFDFEDKLVTGIPTNTAAFYGGRAVTNLILWSQDISNAAWTKSTDAVVTGTDGFTSATQYGSCRISTATIAGHLYTYSFTASVPVGLLTGYKIEYKDSDTGDRTGVTFSRTPTRYSVTVLGHPTSSTVKFGISDDHASDWAKIIFTDALVEDVTGQTNQNPSDHIPTTTAAVSQYYSTTNANTVSSNVVTETAGTALTNTIGWATWPSTTNVIGSAVYRDFTHADWNVTDCSITAGTVVLIDGTSVDDKNTLTASGANGTMILDPYTSASGVHAGGVFIKRKTGTGAIEVTVDGGSTWVAVTTQVAGDAGWHLCETTLPTVTDPEFGVRLVTSGDAVYLDWAQMDDGYARVCSHPIVGAETLGAQTLTADATNADKLIKNKQGYVIAHAQLLPDDLSIAGGKLVDNGESVLYIKANDNDASSSDGTNTLEYNNSVTGLEKIASYWGHETDKKQLSAGGASSATGAYDGAWGTDPVQLGEDHNGIVNEVIFGVNIKTTQTEMETETT